MDSNINLNTISTQLTQLSQESENLKPEEALTKLNHISHEILSYTSTTKDFKPADTKQIQNILRQVEALNERLQAHTPVGKVIEKMKNFIDF